MVDPLKPFGRSSVKSRLRRPSPTSATVSLGSGNRRPGTSRRLKRMWPPAPLSRSSVVSRILRPLLLTGVAWLFLVVLLAPYSYHTRLMTLYGTRIGPSPGSDPTTMILLHHHGPVRLQPVPSTRWHDRLPDLRRLDQTQTPHYNGLRYVPGRWANRTRLAGRRIHHNDHAIHHKERARLLRRWDEETDEKDLSDSEPDKYAHYEEKDYPKEDGCYRLKWSFQQNSACNTVHERIHLGRDLSEFHPFGVEFLGRGHFRTSYRFTSRNQATPETFVLKNIRYHERRNWNAFTFDQIQIEELGFTHTQGSKLTTNLYARCGTSMVVESGTQIRYSIYPMEDNLDQAKLDKVQTDDVIPFNKLTLQQKLKVALQMAESLALLHGNSEGVIVNDDIQVEQWLLGADGNIKLNDFNNAIIPKWNVQNQEYCTFRVSYHYVYRSPQELKHKPTDETGDVFALGLIFYTLMTGLMPFYERKDWAHSIKAVGGGALPYIDPRYRNRSLIERRLVEIMEPTWAFHYQDRASIFQVVQGLRETVDEYEKLHPGTNIREVDLTDLPTLDSESVDEEEYFVRMEELRQRRQQKVA